jgi:hypothetical protein
MMIFLIEYDPREGRSVTILTFDASDRAIARDARLRLELDLNDRCVNHEVVLLEANDEAALRRTHARYFEDAGQIVERFLDGTKAFVVRESKD